MILSPWLFPVWYGHYLSYKAASANWWELKEFELWPTVTKSLWYWSRAVGNIKNHKTQTWIKMGRSKQKSDSFQSLTLGWTPSSSALTLQLLFSFWWGFSFVFTYLPEWKDPGRSMLWEKPLQKAFSYKIIPCPTKRPGATEVTEDESAERLKLGVYWHLAATLPPALSHEKPLWKFAKTWMPEQLFTSPYCATVTLQQQLHGLPLDGSRREWKGASAVTEAEAWVC